MIDEAAASTDAVPALATRPLDTLRVNVPTAFGEPFIAPVLPHSSRRTPDCASS